MDTIFMALVIFVVIMGLITLVGHGIWLVLAAMFGQSKSHPQKCVFCSRMTHVTERSQRCDWCGRSLTSPLAVELADLQAVNRQLLRFRANGTLTPETAQRLQERLNNYRRQLAPQQWQPEAALEMLRETVKSEKQPAGTAPPVAIPVGPLVSAPVSHQPLPEVAPVVESALPKVPAECTAKPQAAVIPVAPHVHVPPPKPAPAKLPTPAAPVPSRPQHSWTEILAAFMEERNIHWGELIGGLLIVCSSTALVVSLWPHLKTIPYFQFFIFVTITSAIFGVGLYAHHRWKLASTSRGILDIATLLVPLNFVAMAGMPQETWTPAVLIPQLASLAIFAWLVALAARITVADARWLLCAAVLGNSAAMLAFAPLVSSEISCGRFMSVGMFCVGLLVLAVGGHLFQLGGKRFTGAQCRVLFTLLGLAGFSTAVAVSLLTVQATTGTAIVLLLHRCSPLAALFALPVMAVGLTVHARNGTRSLSLDSFRLAGTTVALIAFAGLLAAVGLAWPQPDWIIAVATFDMLVLGWAAFRWRMPMLHAGAIACAALAYLTVFHKIAGGLPMPADAVQSYQLLALTVSARSGTALGGLFVVLALISEWLARHGYRRHGVYYVRGCVAAAVTGLVLTTYHGFAHGGADALRAAILYGVYGSGCLALAARWRRVEFSYLGMVLLAAVLPWGFAWQPATRVMGPALGTLAVNRSRWPWQGACLHPASTPPRRSLSQGGIASGRSDRMVGTRAHHSRRCLAAFIDRDWQRGVRGRGLFPSRRSLRIVLACRGLGQSFLSFAALLGAALWLKHTGAITQLENLADDPHNLQVCGIALAILSLAWIVLRIALRGIIADTQPVGLFSFLVRRNSVDRIVRHAVIVGQFLLLGNYLMPAVQSELVVAVAPATAAFGAAAWILAGVLSLTLLVALWDQWREEELVAALLMAASIAGLIAGQFAIHPQLGAPAAASALRWGMSCSLFIASVAIWQRMRLAAWCRAIHGRVQFTRPDSAAAIARCVALTVMAAPVILLTACSAALQLGGIPSGGPVGGFFVNIGPTWNYLVPLALVMVAMVGHAMRERSSGYAFSAGLVLELAVTLGYALHVSLSKQAIDPATFYASLIQWATIAAGVWAIVWLLARRWIEVWKEGDRQLPRILMKLQIGMALAGNAVLVGESLRNLALDTPAAQQWCIAAGRLPGWLALLLPIVALLLRGRLRPNMVGLYGMAVLGLLACTIRGLAPSCWGHPVDPIWAYRTLMLAWAVYALLVVLAAWWASSLRTSAESQGPSQALLRMAAIWVRAASILAVLLGLKAAFFHDSEQLWAAATIAVASVASATMAVWRRREGWAFTTAWGINLAASLVVWYFEMKLGLAFDQWRLRLIQANIIATSAFALVWLAARHRLYELRELRLGDSPLLALQIAVAIIGNAILLVPTVLAILQAPGDDLRWIRQIGAAPGWLALLLTTIAAGWYLRQTLPGNLAHVLGGLALAAGMLAACSISLSGVPYCCALWLGRLTIRCSRLGPSRLSCFFWPDRSLDNSSPSRWLKLGSCSSACSSRGPSCCMVSRIRYGHGGQPA